MFIGFSAAFSMRVNLSVAIVAMMDRKAANPEFPVSKETIKYI